MMTADQADAVMRAKVEVLREYAGTDTHNALIALFQAMRVSYMHDLLTVPWNCQRMSDLQTAARQVQALEQALGDKHAGSPRI